MSQTQLANFATIAGLLVLIAQQFGFVLSQDKLVFLLGAGWSVGWTIYNYWQRYQKGDLTIGGARK